MMCLRFHKNFDKQYQKLSPKQKAKVKERLTLFLENPFDVQLNNHPLKGKYIGYRSINITGDLRAIFKAVGEEECILVAVDIHSNLYS